MIPQKGGKGFPRGEEFLRNGGPEKKEPKKGMLNLADKVGDGTTNDTTIKASN
jgi:hypothetical protein